jgi:hypothetical protein
MIPLSIARLLLLKDKVKNLIGPELLEHFIETITGLKALSRAMGDCECDVCLKLKEEFLKHTEKMRELRQEYERTYPMASKNDNCLNTKLH